ncbi:hypothetical protein B0H13DRAFT_1896047 [Mycena leptocephala]|nr:hypothetical protein B0H13DRAFT_1896047 [Mycena leptocephala]
MVPRLIRICVHARPDIKVPCVVRTHTAPATHEDGDVEDDGGKDPFGHPHRTLLHLCECDAYRRSLKPTRAAPSALEERQRTRRTRARAKASEKEEGAHEMREICVRDARGQRGRNDLRFLHGKRTPTKAKREGRGGERGQKSGLRASAESAESSKGKRAEDAELSVVRAPAWRNQAGIRPSARCDTPTPRWTTREREPVRDIHERGGKGQCEGEVSTMKQSKHTRMWRGIGHADEVAL